MKKDQNKRLFGAMDYLDDDLAERAAKRIKERPVGEDAGKLSKKKAFRQVAMLAACLLLLGAAVPLAGRIINYIPEMLNPAGTVDGAESNTLETNESEPPEEYFTDGGTGILFYPSYYLGVEYDGCWIHVSGASRGSEFFEYLYKYDPVAKTSTSLCIDSSCNHSNEACPVFVPEDWKIDSITVFGDWCLYMCSERINIDSNNTSDSVQVHLYNMKTGEARVIAETNTPGYYPRAAFALDGKVYLSICDYAFDQGFQIGIEHNFIDCYDPKTQKTEYVCDIPEDMYLVGVTNKRFFLSDELLDPQDSDADIWMIDYSGENYRKMANFNFTPVYVCGEYAYGVDDSAYILIYDLTTDSVTTVDFSAVQNAYIDAGELGYTTTSRIEEYKEYQKDPDAYIAKHYPNVTDPSQISKLKSETELKLNVKVDVQFYLTDAKGENPTLVYEGKNLWFNPYRRVGDYIIGTVRIGSKYENRILDDGFAALNLKTGEIEMIPALTFN